jgi:hypothetical protein
MVALLIALIAQTPLKGMMLLHAKEILLRTLSAAGALFLQEVMAILTLILSLTKTPLVLVLGISSYALT